MKAQDPENVVVVERSLFLWVDFSSSKRYYSGVRTSERIFFTLFLLIFFGLVISAGQMPWRTETCTVTAKAENAFTAAEGQDWDYVETTCGNLGVRRWPAQGYDIIEKLEVGKTYHFGVNGFALAWGRENIVSYEEVAE